MKKTFLLSVALAFAGSNGINEHAAKPELRKEVLFYASKSVTAYWDPQRFA